MKQNFVCFNNMVHKNTIKFILKHGGFNKIIRATYFFINSKCSGSYLAKSLAFLNSLLNSVVFKLYH